MVLAESIATNGISPIDLLLVMPEKRDNNRYIVLEGNRRAAALKILSNPHVLADMDIPERTRKRFEDLSVDFLKTPTTKISVAVMHSREEGLKWVYLRHTGENDGEGVVGWSGIAAARFRGDHPAIQALEFVRAFGNLDAEQMQLVSSRFPITTLDRLLKAPAVRKAIGVTIEKNKLLTHVAAGEVIRPLRRMVLDIAEKRINVTRLKSAAQQLSYVSEMVDLDRADLTRAIPPKTIQDITGLDLAPASKVTAKKRHNADPSNRKTIVPARMRMNITDPKIAHIFRELKGLKAAEFINAGAVLLRVFLELSVDSYFRSHGLSLKIKANGGRIVDKRLDVKVKETVEDLVAKGADRKDFIGVTRGLSVQGSPFSIELFNAYVHNLFVIPREREILAAWDEAQPFFVRIWE